LFNSAGTLPDLESARDYNERVAETVGPVFERWVEDNPLFEPEQMGTPMVTQVRTIFNGGPTLAEVRETNPTSFESRAFRFRTRMRQGTTYRAALAGTTAPLYPTRPPPPPPNNGMSLEMALGRINEGDFIGFI